MDRVNPVCPPHLRWGGGGHKKGKYKAMMKEKHQNFQIHRSGFVVSKTYPFIGASPHGFVTCSCCGGLVEIKCPSKPRKSTISEFAKMPQTHLTVRGGGGWCIYSHFQYSHPRLPRQCSRNSWTPWSNSYSISYVPHTGAVPVTWHWQKMLWFGNMDSRFIALKCCEFCPTSHSLKWWWKKARFFGRRRLWKNSQQESMSNMLQWCMSVKQWMVCWTKFANWVS